MNKKQWQKPELIVLVRSKPEESVLQTCKVIYQEIGPGYNASTCGQPAKPDLCMAICSSTAGT